MGYDFKAFHLIFGNHRKSEFQTLSTNPNQGMGFLEDAKRQLLRRTSLRLHLLFDKDVEVHHRRLYLRMINLGCHIAPNLVVYCNEFMVVILPKKYPTDMP
jgi:hypothetical protein